MNVRRVLVCGAGSIGRRHIANLLQLGVEVSVWRARAELLDQLAGDFPVRPYTDVDAAIAKCDAVVVATATDQHVTVASQVLQAAGRALFIEKPVSHDWAGIDRLRGLASGRLVEVGCQLRAHPNLIALARILHGGESGPVFTYRHAMGHRLDAWRPNGDYRTGYSADSARGGGALFDLIHMIDLALWFFGPVREVNAVLSRVSDLELAGDDVANLLLTHECGITGHIQLDMASPVHRSEVEVITTDALFRWSNADGALRRHTSAGSISVDAVPSGFERNDLFLSHMRHFLMRMDDPTVPALCSIEDGVAALQVALAARESSRTDARVKVGGS